MSRILCPSALFPAPGTAAETRTRGCHGVQVLGRQLEALVDRARTLRDKWGDKFVSVEHLVLAFTQDQRFGQTLMRSFALTAEVRRRAPSLHHLSRCCHRDAVEDDEPFLGETNGFRVTAVRRYSCRSQMLLTREHAWGGMEERRRWRRRRRRFAV